MSKLEKIDLRGTPNTELERILNAAIDRINELEAKFDSNVHPHPTDAHPVSESTKEKQ